MNNFLRKQMFLGGGIAAPSKDVDGHREVTYG